MVGKWLAGLFGGGASNDQEPQRPEPTSYEGHLIYPMPRKEGGQWLTAGLITREIDGEVKEHPFIRADKHGSQQEAADFSIIKAKQIIDQQKQFLFDDHNG